MKLAFIGGGAMAEAMIRGVLSASLAGPEDISVGEIVESRCRYLTDQYRVYATPNNTKAVSKGDLVVLSVKPQNLQEVAPDIKDALADHQTVLSIIAGVRMSTLIESLDHSSVSRERRRVSVLPLRSSFWYIPNLVLWRSVNCI